MLLRKIIRKVVDRRHRNDPVKEDRRHDGVSQADARKRLNEAVQRLEDALATPDDKAKREAINDRQQTVIFSTYREICKWKGPELGRVKLCRSAKHPDAINDDIQICNEEKCPMLTAALRGEAA